jgi:hypothetical protein
LTSADSVTSEPAVMADVVLHALGVEVGLTVDEGTDDLLAALGPLLTRPSGRPPMLSWSIERDAGGWWFRPGPSASSTAPEVTGLLGPMVDRLNRLVCRSGPMVAVHAGAVAVRDAGLLLSGPAEAGKSTLTAGLVCAGASYLGDEAVGIDAAAGRLLAYPKPLTLDPGSHHLFPDLADIAVAGSGTDRRWHVPVHAIRRDAVATDAPLTHVVLCQYESGATTALHELSRAETVYELAEQTFRFKERPRRSLDTLATAVAAASCHRLIVGDLDAAVRAVLELVSAVPASSAG